LPKYIYADPLECSGCKLCVLACSFTFDKVLDPNRARIGAITQDHLDILIACRNCEDAMCMKACQREAIYRDSRGVIMVNADKCDGCAACLNACPYGAIKIHPTRRVAIKCTLCGACIEWCPAECLKVVEDLD